MIDLLKRYWDVFSGVIVGLLYSFIVQWELYKIQLAYSIIILILVIIGFFRFFIKTNIKHKDLIDRSLETQRFTKAIHIAENPSQEGEELGQLVLETIHGGKKVMKKIKNFFKRVWGNKFTLANITINLLIVAMADFLVFSEFVWRFPFFVENHVAFKIVVPIVTAIYFGIDVFTTVTKYGWENLGELQQKTAQKALQKASKLSKEQKAVIKQQITNAKTSIDNLESELVKVNEIIKNFEILKSLNGLVPITQDNMNLYQNSVAKKPSLEAQVSQLKLNLSQLYESLK